MVEKLALEFGVFEHHISHHGVLHAKYFSMLSKSSACCCIEPYRSSILECRDSWRSLMRATCSSIARDHIIMPLVM